MPDKTAAILLAGALGGTLALAAEFPEHDTEAVNEGTLQFLATPPAHPVHHHVNRLTIQAGSVQDGWVRLDQCHRHLDPVPDLEIVYNPHRTRGLTVISHSGIDAARVDGASAQLTGVTRDARLCLGLETRALHADANGGFSLRNGPFMRRFLDGYYPMHVTLDIRYPAQLLQPLGHAPDAQPGFDVQHGDGRLNAEAWFEGRLSTEFRFCRVTACPDDRP